MNFFKLYMGDYQRDTGALSIAEHGAYFLMLQYHYATEKPLPKGKDLYRLLRCESKADREAVESVARQFWRETPEGLVNNRAEEEIAIAQEQEGDSEERKRNERERQRRHRERRKQMYEQLRAAGVTPPFDATTEELQALLNADVTRDTAVTVTPDATANHSHSHNHKSQKLSSASADPPPGFAKFWTTWPRSERKQGKAKCLAIWKRKGLESKADAVVAHVAHMAKSESWQTGFDPMPETYLNGDRWDGADLTATGVAKPWEDSWSGIVSKGAELGIFQDEGESGPDFKARVMTAAKEIA